jgi:hypothetical protein
VCAAGWSAADVDHEHHDDLHDHDDDGGAGGVCAGYV